MLQSHHGMQQKTVKTAHIKAKKHTLTPSYIHSSVHACTQTHTEGQIYFKCTLFWDKHQTKIQMDYSQYHFKKKKKKKEPLMKTHSVRHPQTIPDGSEHDN